MQDVLVKMFRLHVTLHSEEHFSFPMPPLFSISLLPSFHSDIIHLGKHGGNQVGAGAVAENCILVCKQRRGRREKESEKRERRSDINTLPPTWPHHLTLLIFKAFYFLVTKCKAYEPIVAMGAIFFI